MQRIIGGTARLYNQLIDGGGLFGFSSPSNETKKQITQSIISEMMYAPDTVRITPRDMKLAAVIIHKRLKYIDIPIHLKDSILLDVLTDQIQRGGHCTQTSAKLVYLLRTPEMDLFLYRLVRSSQLLP